MARRLTWSSRAIEQIDEIAEYISKSSGFYPKAVVKRIFDRMETVPDQPGQGRRLPEYEGTLEYREVFVHRWRVIYRVEPQDVIVVAVIHGARLLQSADPFEA